MTVEAFIEAWFAELISVKNDTVRSSGIELGRIENRAIVTACQNMRESVCIDENHELTERALASL